MTSAGTASPDKRGSAHGGTAGAGSGLTGSSRLGPNTTQRNNNPGVNSATNSNGITGSSTPTLQFIPWFTLTAAEPTIISTLIPPPHNIVWEPSQDFVVLVYADEFVVFSAKQKLKFLSRVPLQITSGVWVNKTFFFATLQSVACYFPHVSNRTCVLLANVHQPVLSAFSDSSYSNMGSSGTSSGGGSVAGSSSGFAGAGLSEGLGNIFTTASSSAASSINRKPVGPVRILGLFDQALIMVDSFLDIHHLTLTDPNLKCRMLISAGVVNIGLSWGMSLPFAQQDDIAIFLYQRGLGMDALTLPGINQWLQFHLYVRERQYLQALQTAETIAKECEIPLELDRNDEKKKDKNNETSMTGPAGTDGASESYESKKDERAKSGIMNEMSSYDVYNIEEDDDASFLNFIKTCKKPAIVTKEDVVRLFVLLANRCNDEDIALQALFAAAKFDRRVYQQIIVKYSTSATKKDKLIELISALVEDGKDHFSGFLASAIGKDNRHMLMALLRSGRHPEAAEFASRDPSLNRVLPSIIQKWSEDLPPDVQVNRT